VAPAPAPTATCGRELFSARSALAWLASVD
jgi:hypothetical protein